MTNADFSAREPHNLILDHLSCLTRETSQPLWGKHDWAEVHDGFTEEQLQEAIEELIKADILVERTDPHSGFEQIGLKDLVEADEAPYQELKASVYKKAKARGLWPKFRPGQGWRLVDGGGRTVTTGNMEALDGYLSVEPSLEQDALGSA